MVQVQLQSHCPIIVYEPTSYLPAASWSAVLDAMKPGVMWTDMHALAYRTLLTKLKEGGLLT